MTDPRPSYQDGEPLGPKRPAAGLLLTGLFVLSLPEVPPILGILAFVLLAMGVVAFGVYLASIVMMRHTQWLEDR